VIHSTTVHCQDLYGIFGRIMDRVNRASASFLVAATLLARRMEVESRIAAMLDEVIPRDFDPKDPVLTGLVEELRNEDWPDRSLNPPYFWI
jgi:hypothetical protein